MREVVRWGMVAFAVWLIAADGAVVGAAENVPTVNPGGGTLTRNLTTLPDEGQHSSLGFPELVREMSDRGTLAKWPVLNWRNRQASAMMPDKRHNPGFHAGKQIGHFVRIEDKGGGRKEWVLMEHDGPGVIVRMWSPNMAKDAVFRVYLDRAKTPEVEVNMMKFFYGEDFAKPPFAALKARGGNVYLPIPFARSCKVTVDKNECGWAAPADLFYVIQYRAYDRDARIRTFAMEEYQGCASLLAEVGRELEGESKGQDGGVPVFDTSLEARQKEEIELKAGPAAIACLSVKMEAADLPGALRALRLKMSFDGEQTVDCPAGDFFGSGQDLNPFHDWMRTVSKEGVLSCRWVMPYEKSAKLKFENTGSVAMKLSVAVSYRPWTWNGQSMHFHSNWGLDRGINILPTPNFNYITIKGRGVYVGDTLSVTSYSESWWGEGMEKIVVDDEPFPSQLGTGSEDYYGYAWGDTKIYDAPFIAQPRIPEGPGYLGTTVNTRIRSLDAIPFSRSLRLDMEVLTQDSFKGKFAELDYGVCTYWYGATNTVGEWRW